MVKKQVDKVWISLEGITIPWEVLEEVCNDLRRKIDVTDNHDKKMFRQGQLNVYYDMLDFQDKLIEESTSIHEKN